MSSCVVVLPFVVAGMNVKGLAISAQMQPASLSKLSSNNIEHFLYTQLSADRASSKHHHMLSSALQSQLAVLAATNGHVAA